MKRLEWCDRYFLQGIHVVSPLLSRYSNDQAAHSCDRRFSTFSFPITL